MRNASNCPPISEDEYFSRRAHMMPNQLRVVELQVSPNMDKAHHTDKLVETKSQPPMTYILSQFLEKKEIFYETYREIEHLFEVDKNKSDGRERYRLLKNLVRCTNKKTSFRSRIQG